MKTLESKVIISLILALCLLIPSVGFGEAKPDPQKTPIQKLDVKPKIRPKTKVLAVMPDLTISKISIRKSSGYIYITPTIKSLTAKGCEDVDLKFSINNTIHQPYMGVRFDGNSEFALTGLGFEDEGASSCSIKIQITRGCRELNLSNNSKSVSLAGIGSTARIIEF